MKKYEIPSIEFYKLEKQDIITSSPGTETPVIDGFEGSWELDTSINS